MVPFLLETPKWAFSEELILQSGASDDEYHTLTQHRGDLYRRWYHYEQDNGVRPILSAAHDVHYSEVLEDSQRAQFNVTLH